MKGLLTALLLSITFANASASDVVAVKVYKAQRKLDLILKGDYVLKSYKIMLGKNPVGHKIQEGDNKTPEGIYTLDYKNPASKFRKSLHVSYPNLQDKLNARALGVRPGGDIMIHGLPNDFKAMTEWLSTVGLEGYADDAIRSALPFFDWTSGCIAVTDKEIDEIYSLIDTPTKIIIYP